VPVAHCSAPSVSAESLVSGATTATALTSQSSVTVKSRSTMFSQASTVKEEVGVASGDWMSAGKGKFRSFQR
jgi:hypothetical protein